MEKRFYTQSVSFLFSSWTCREYDSMLNLINVWIPVLPEWILENIKQQLILPRLQVRIRAIFIFVDRIFFHRGLLEPSKFSFTWRSHFGIPDSFCCRKDPIVRPPKKIHAVVKRVRD